MTLARTPYARLSPADIGQVDRELKKLEQMSAGLYVPKVLVAARSPYPVQGTDTMLLCDCTAGAITLTFPLAARVDGMSVQVVKSDTSANAVTLSGTFSGVVNPTLTVPESGFTVLAMNGSYHVTAFVPYPIVTGETGVTSIVYAYGDVRRYGAKLDGVTNDRAAFVAADASATLGIGGVSRVIQTTGTALIGSNITLVNPFRPYPGAKVRPANAVVVTMNGSIHAGLYPWIDTSVGGKVVFAKGSVVSVHPQWWGSIASGFGDATFTAMYAALNTGNNTWNPRVRMPAADYFISTGVAAPNSLSHVQHVGDGRRSTRIIWNGGVAAPVLKFTNARSVKFRGIGLFGLGVAPTYGIQFDSVTAGKTATPIACGGTDMFIGSDSTNGMVTGVAFTTSDGSDQNNEQSFWSDCDFYNCSSAGVRAEHSNSNWHTLLHCSFSDCHAAISTYKSGVAGGNFTAVSCHQGNTTDNTSTFVEAGGQLYPTKLIGCDSESAGFSYLVYTPDPITIGSGGIEIHGGSFQLRDTTAILWNSSTNSVGVRARFTLDGGARVIAQTLLVFDFPGTDPVFLSNFHGNFGTLKYNGRTTVQYVDEWRDFASAGMPTATNYGSGRFLYTNPATNNSTPSTVLPTGTTPDVTGFQHQAIATCTSGVARAITNLTGGFHGLEITLWFQDGNTTLQNGFFFLNGTINYTPTQNSTVTLKCTDVGGGVLRWIEKSRMTR